MWPVTSIIRAAKCQAVGRKGRIVIVALRRIDLGEEITYDYGAEYRKFFLDNGGCRFAACIRRKALRRKRARMRRALEAAAVTR
jgi:SET domain-containing protein